MALIKEIPEEFRPYEKVRANGVDSLDDSELLAVILRTGFRGTGSVELARSLLLHGNGSLSGLRRMSLQDLMEIPGIGEVKAIQILCLCALIPRFVRSEFRNEEIYDSPEKIAARFMEEMRAENQEILKALFLNGKGLLLGEKNMTRGSADKTIIPIRELLVEALKNNADKLVVLHNHPSGDPSPSQADTDATVLLQRAAALSGITLWDHLIIGDRSYVSFRETGYIT